MISNVNLTNEIMYPTTGTIGAQMVDMDPDLLDEVLTGVNICHCDSHI